jgi:3-dehydro-4-phosphotetronate decarboxylase
MNEQRHREDIVALGRSFYERGLTFGSAGNISVRLEDGWLLTPTNVSLGALDPGRLTRLDADGRHVAGDAPTKELPLHHAMYAMRSTAQAVVHLHSTHSVAVSCLADCDPANALPPITAYQIMRVGPLPLVPYMPPGDPGLADAVRPLASKHHAILLANHGPIVAGTSLSAAAGAIEELEETAKLHLLLRGERVRYLTTEEIAELEARFGVGN